MLKIRIFITLLLVILLCFLASGCNGGFADYSENEKKPAADDKSGSKTIKFEYANQLTIEELYGGFLHALRQD